MDGIYDNKCSIHFWFFEMMKSKFNGSIDNYIQYLIFKYSWKKVDSKIRLVISWIWCSLNNIIVIIRMWYPICNKVSTSNTPSGSSPAKETGKLSCLFFFFSSNLKTYIWTWCKSKSVISMIEHKYQLYTRLTKCLASSPNLFLSIKA